MVWRRLRIAADTSLAALHYIIQIVQGWGNDHLHQFHDPTPKSCSIQKQNSGMINTPLSGGCADEKVTIHRRTDCLCPETGRAGYIGA
ncbi:plasmid pRiA4b ORF-3 family protein [Serratia fonticola]|uniref:plasmid pRiA4b ORF-3 family protein n=1 Tax=Serratia fonticola TaxID=47917 RepID=UPI001F1E0651